MNFKEIPELNSKSIPRNVKIKTSEFFTYICNGRTYRKSQRQTRIYGALYEAFDYYNIQVTPLYIQELLGCPDSVRNTGLGIYTSRTGKEITALNLIQEMVDKLNYGEIDIDTIETLYNIAYSRTKLIDRSEPKSVAAALLYYYYIKAGIDINKKHFSKTTGPSINTISSIYTELISVL